MISKINVLIAEDMEPLRKKYIAILQQDPHFNVIAGVGSGVEVIQASEENVPDVILMDIAMETKDAGIRAMAQILMKHPEVKIIILTIYEEDETVYAAFQMGAVDYLLKNASSETIKKAIIDAYNNETAIRPEIASKLRDEFRRVKNYESSFLFMLHLLSSLTSSELDTLYLLSNGYSRKDVCKMRVVEMSTIKSQVNSILKKTGKKRIQDIIVTSVEQQFLLYVLQQNKNR